MATSVGNGPVTDGKVALVTGGSSGIGRVIANELARAGYRVFGTVRSGRAPAAVETLVMDVRDQASVQAAVDRILEQAHRIDVLVNNAGSALVGAVEETDTAQAQALFDVNFFGAARVTQAVLPTMRAEVRADHLHQQHSRLSAPPLHGLLFGHQARDRGLR
jgi:NAD(P)-dependent dehydrogenase (short-subunit alcohol dehydrogenase family)